MNKTDLRYINLDYLETVTEGDHDMQREMLAMIVEELTTELPKMRNCLNQNDWRGLRDISHKFKTTLAFVGNDLMAEANKEIEHIARTGTGSERLPLLLSILEDLQPGVRQELSAVSASV